jgi:hypothetical protein
MTIIAAFSELVRNPGELLVRRWNWKVAAFSAGIRGTIFLLTNLSAGWDAARGAMLAEFVYRALTAGFYGAVSQQMRRITPPRKGTLAAMLIVPAFAHLIEFCLHTLRGTPNLRNSITASVAFSILSVLFNLHIMRAGAMIIGNEGRSFSDDMKRMPGLILSFLLYVPARLVELVTGRTRAL